MKSGETGRGRVGKRFTPRYDRMTRRASSTVIGTYSTSFSMATRLLGKRVREDIRNLYAMVRIADEIVDGTAAEAGCSGTQIRALLDDYERAVLAAQAADQLQFGLKIDVMRQFDMLEEACGLHIVAMAEDEFFVLGRGAGEVFAKLSPAQGAIDQRHGDRLALRLTGDETIATGELRRLGL